MRRARQHAAAQHLNVRLHRGSIASLRRWVAPSSLDAVICTEVLYLCRDYRQLLGLLADSVRPGGLVCISHRPTLYYLASALRQGRADLAAPVLTRGEGPSPDGDYHNWQTSEELTQLYQTQSLRLLGCYPVDHSDIPLDVSLMTDPNVQQCLASARSTNGTFRIPAYLLVIAEKT